MKDAANTIDVHDATGDNACTVRSESAGDGEEAVGIIPGKREGIRAIDTWRC